MGRRAEVSIWITAKDMARRELNATTRVLGRVRGAVFSLQGALAGLGIALGLKSFIKASSTAESFQLRLESLTGSQEKANHAFREGARLAARMPHEYRDVMGSVTALTGVMEHGVDEALSWMPLISDLAAVSGLSLEETTSQFIRMYSAGAASADMFRERGILAMLGFKAGVSYNVQETRKAIIDSWVDVESKFRGASDRLANSWEGLTSMLSDRWFQFRQKVGEKGLFDEAKTAMNTLLDKLDELAEDGTIDEWAQGVSDFAVWGIRALSDLMGAVSRTIDWIANHPLLMTGGLLGLLFFGPGGAAVIGAITGYVEQAWKNLVAPIGVTGVEQIETKMAYQVEQLHALNKRRRRIEERLARSGGLWAEDSGPATRRQEELRNQLDEVNEAAANAEARIVDLNEQLNFLRQNAQEGFVSDIAGQLEDLEQRLEENIRRRREGRGEAPSGEGGPPEIPPEFIGRNLPREYHYRHPGRAQVQFSPPERAPAGQTGWSQALGVDWESTAQHLREMSEYGTQLDNVISGMVSGSLSAFSMAVEDGFRLWVEGSISAGQAFEKAMLAAIGSVAAAMGDYYRNEAVGAIGRAIGGEVSAWAEAAKYMLAATGFYALAGSMRGAGGGGGGISGAAQAQRDIDDFSGSRGEATIIIEGGLLDMSDPRQQDALARALSNLSDRRITIIGG